MPRYGRLHLFANKAGRVTDECLEIAELALERAVAYFGAERELYTVRVGDVRSWIAWLETFKNKRVGV